MYNEYIVSHAPLESGDTVHTDCPACGRTKLYITRAEDGSGILYNCFKSSCNIRGRINPTGVSYPNVIRVTPEEPKGNPFVGKVHNLTNEQLEFLNQEVGFSEQHINVARPMYVQEQDRFAFPILNPVGQRQGWVLRAYDGRAPKALSFLDEGATRLSHYRCNDSSRALLVEDIPSAVRGSSYLNTVAILGTSIKSSDQLELQMRYDELIICLDADAVRQAVDLHRQLDLLFKRVTIVVPPCDLKDMTEAQLMEFLR